MAIAFRAAGTAASGTTNLTPAVPAGNAADDIMLLVHEGWGNAAATLATANGFVELLHLASGLGPGSAEVTLTVFWKRSAGSDSDPIVTANATAGACRIYGFSGCITSGNPWDVTSSTADSGGGAGGDTAFSVAGATTTVANTMVVIPVVGNASAGGTGITIFSITNANLASITNQDTSNYTPGGIDWTMFLITGTKASIGTYAATTGTLSSAERNISAATIALKPAPTGLTFKNLLLLGTG